MARAAKSIRSYYKFFTHQRTETVLDYGAGKLRNARYLARKGFTVFAADLPEQVDQLRDFPDAGYLAGILDSRQLTDSCLNVDLVISTYVFNIINSISEQTTYVENIVSNLKLGGYLLMEVRCRRIEECGEGCSHFFKCQECAKTFTYEELDGFLVPHGFRRISHYYRNHALAAIYQLQPDLVVS
jgi:cyclopropane fatty-acyl-phospholipid synthase-like methyltransferase